MDEIQSCTYEPESCGIHKINSVCGNVFHALLFYSTAPEAGGESTEPCFDTRYISINRLGHFQQAGVEVLCADGWNRETLLPQ